MRAAVLVSGRGSNMAALIDAAKAPDYPAEIALVVSNVPEAGALAIAAVEGIATAVVEHRAFADRESFDAALDAQLRAAAVDVVCLAGFMRILSAGFVARWRGRLVNIHPSLLPAFRGLHTHRRALESGALIHGCTVHLVTPALDEGLILVQAAVPVLADDDEDRLAARVLAAEHRICPTGLALVAQALLGTSAPAIPPRADAVLAVARDSVPIA